MTLPARRFATLFALQAVIISGCERVEENPIKKEGEAFMRENAQKRGVVSTDSGWQYQIIERGDDTPIGSDDRVFGEMARIGLDGKPIYDGSNLRFIRPPKSFGKSPVAQALTMVGQGGKIRVFLPWDNKGSYLVEPRGPIGPDETVIWELTVHRLVDDADKKSIAAAGSHPSAGVLIFDKCGTGKADLLLPEGCTSDLVGYGERFVHPECRALEKKNTVPIQLVSSEKRNPGWPAERKKRWEWVGPCAGILVRTGIDEVDPSSISEYIYGTNTGGQDWLSSYEALSYLDRDGDGWLSGGELGDVSVWTDSNTNGIPEPDEVEKAEISVERIQTKPTEFTRLDRHVEGEGVIFKDGRKVSSWCWGTRGMD